MGRHGFPNEFRNEVEFQGLRRDASSTDEPSGPRRDQGPFWGYAIPINVTTTNRTAAMTASVEGVVIDRNDGRFGCTISYLLPCKVLEEQSHNRAAACFWIVPWFANDHGVVRNSPYAVVLRRRAIHCPRCAVLARVR